MVRHIVRSASTIEFKVRYWERGFPGGLSSVACVLNGNEAEVTMVSVGRLPGDSWDRVRAEVIRRPHGEWPSIYAGTALADDLKHSLLPVETVAAVAALHLLAPEAAAAEQLLVAPGSIQGLLVPRVVTDGLGNQLSMYGPLRGQAVDELVRVGQLQLFEVVARDGANVIGGGACCFRPFSRPNAAPSTMTRDAAELLDWLNAQ